MFEELWWIIPLGMMVFCFFMMLGGKGARMCGPGTHGTDQNDSRSDTALEILEKRYAGGAIDKEEFEEKRKALNHSVGSQK